MSAMGTHVRTNKSRNPHSWCLRATDILRHLRREPVADVRNLSGDDGTEREARGDVDRKGDTDEGEEDLHAAPLKSNTERAQC